MTFTVHFRFQLKNCKKNSKYDKLKVKNLQQINDPIGLHRHELCAQLSSQTLHWGWGSGSIAEKDFNTPAGRDCPEESVKLEV